MRPDTGPTPARNPGRVGFPEAILRGVGRKGITRGLIDSNYTDTKGRPRSSERPIPLGHLALVATLVLLSVLASATEEKEPAVSEKPRKLCRGRVFFSVTQTICDS